MMFLMPDALDYASQDTKSNIGVAYAADGSVTITIPTRRSFQRFAIWMASSDLFGFVLIPLGFLLFLVFATKRPRAVLRFSSTNLDIEETDDNSFGLFTKRRSWQTSQIGELRPNRYGAAIYLTIPGRDNVDLLKDLPEKDIEEVCRILADVRKRL